MQKQDACPDLRLARAEGLELYVDGSQEMFPDCPAGYLRTAGDVEMLRVRWGREPFAEHLIDGAIHPATIVSSYAAEIESGARSGDSLTPRVLALVHLWQRETHSKREFERLKRKESHARID